MERSAGILLPVFSLPGPYGIGSLGREARAFAEFLHNAGQRWWQVLPVGPTGAGNSPYTSESTFAGNPLLIDLEDLRDRGLLTEAELSAARVPEGAPIDYAALYESREALLRRAFSRLGGAEAQSVRDFAAANPWLGEYALYRALKARFGQTAWFDWPDKDLLNHDPAALAAARQELAEDIAFHQAVQFWFFSQWKALKDHANGLGVRIIGDLPIYVSLDSADVWSERREFLLDKAGRPSRVAGVPPDYFCADGQLWGNPLYRWDVQEKTDFAWWKERMKASARLYDVVRIDHFIGVTQYYAIPAGSEDGKTGEWLKGPGKKLTDAINMVIGDTKIIAEDLGIFVPEVKELLEETGYPGMKIIEFAFSGDRFNEHLPHMYSPNSVVYGGTHDNETLVGYFKPEARQWWELQYIADYMGVSHQHEVVDKVLKTAYASVASVVIFQAQDVLKLDSWARMNTPGTVGNNWRWRMKPGELTQDHINHLSWLVDTFGRF